MAEEVSENLEVMVLIDCRVRVGGLMMKFKSSKN